MTTWNMKSDGEVRQRGNAPHWPGFVEEVGGNLTALSLVTATSKAASGSFGGNLRWAFGNVGESIRAEETHEGQPEDMGKFRRGLPGRLRERQNPADIDGSFIQNIKMYSLK